jgi:hypothetical protein
MKEAEKEAERIIEMFKPYAEGKAGFALEKEQAKQCALLHVKEKYKEIRETLFNLRACGVINSERTYLNRIADLIIKEQQVKQAIENK